MSLDVTRVAARNESGALLRTVKYQVAVLNSHPIQYFAPFYRLLATCEEIELTVFYCSHQGIAPAFEDPGFGRQVVWDVPLLNGYHYRFLRNIGRDHGVRGFFSLSNLSVIPALSRQRFDAIIIHGHNFLVNLLAIATAKTLGTAVFMRSETHLLLRRRGLKRALRAPALRALYGVCDACLYIGTANRRFYEAHGVPSSRLFFVPYTVDNAHFGLEPENRAANRETVLSQLGIPADATTIVFASKLIGRKRPYDLLQAYHRLTAERANVALLIIGEGAEESGLRRMAVDVPNVHFLGFKNQAELPAYLAAADIFVLPSENEPWGLVINEAMCAGVPVVTTHEVGAALDLVRSGETGYLYDAADVSALADRLRTLVRDPGLRLRMSSNCRRQMARWSYAESMEGLRAALDALHGGKK